MGDFDYRKFFRIEPGKRSGQPCISMSLPFDERARAILHFLAADDAARLELR
jgi:hypothetical protein